MIRTRCPKCEARRGMARRPSRYVRGLRCHSCGHYERDRDKGWRVDKYRTDGRERRAQVTCGCLAYWFPHREGNGRCGAAVVTIKAPPMPRTVTLLKPERRVIVELEYTATPRRPSDRTRDG